MSDIFLSGEAPGEPEIRIGAILSRKDGRMTADT